MKTVRVGEVEFGGRRLALIAGPCVIEDLESTVEIALRLADLCSRLELPFVFKASYDKANRTSLGSWRGPGWERGLEILAQVRTETGAPVLTDVHETGQVAGAAEACDMLQVPAFLSRQTDLLVAVGETGRAVNIKKGQFVAPGDMVHAVAKVTSTGNRRVTLTERGFAFGYNNLVVDMRGIPIMKETGCPVVFDATHSVQLPSGGGCASGGQREYVEPLALAAVAAGADALFMETHPTPDASPCDGPNMIALGDLGPVLEKALGVFRVVRG